MSGATAFVNPYDAVPVTLIAYCPRGKLPYDSIAEARKALSRVRGRRLRDPRDVHALKAYHCEHCGKFHLGRDKERA